MDLATKETFFKKIGYEPHRGQQEFHDSTARFRVASCGRRYGKSTMAARDATPELFLPDRNFWIVGPTYDLGEKEFRVVWNDIMVGLGLQRDKRIRKQYNRKSGSMFIEFPWRTRLEVRSADHPDALVGESLDGVILAEAAKHRRDTWERFIRPALADKGGWATFCTTPEGQNWLYDLYLMGQDPNEPAFASWKMPSWENSVVFPGGREDPEIKLMEKSTSPEWFAQEIAAEFTSFVGKIYPEFDDSMHIRNHEFRPDWPNYIFWDWGYVNPLAAIEVQISPSDDVFIWREHYQPWLRLEEHIRAMKNRSQPEGYHITCTYGDSADQEAVHTVNSLFAPCIASEDAKKNWRQGIEVVKRFLKPAPTGLHDSEGLPILKPKLFVSAYCTNTIKEFHNYKMAKKGLRSQLDPAEKAHKKDDHAMDAIRYGLMHLFELGAKYHLDEVMTQPTKYEPAPVDNSFITAGASSEVGLFTQKMGF